MNKVKTFLAKQRKTGMHAAAAMLVLLAASLRCMAQTPVSVDCNTVFICLDTASYNALFTNPYIKDTLFYCREESTKTTDDAYTGKYAQGQSATLEFFKPVDFNTFGNHEGDCGLEFKTRFPGGLALLAQKAKTLHIKTDTSTTSYDDSDRQISWYKTIKIANHPETFELSILEYQRAYLERKGFTTQEIDAPMPYAAFIRKVSHGHKFRRQFSAITSVTMEGNGQLLKGLRSFCRLIGFRQNRYLFYGPAFRLYYKPNNTIAGTKIDQVRISLLTRQAGHFIQVAPGISVSVHDNTAVIDFK